ncbi:MAG TPA: SRPBCC family protein [Thermomicrobiales bacterium]
MGLVQRSVVIEAPVEEVFGLMTDTSRFDTWVFGFAGLDEGPTKLSQDTKFRWKMKGHGLTLKPRSTIVAFDAPTGYEEEIRIPGILRGRLSKRIVAEKRRTRLSWSLEYRLIGGPLGAAADWAVARRVAERAVQRSLAGAKQVLEARKQSATARGGYRRQTAVR